MKVFADEYDKGSLTAEPAWLDLVAPAVPPRSWHPHRSWELNCCRQIGQQNIWQETFVKFNIIRFQAVLDLTHTTLC